MALGHTLVLLAPADHGWRSDMVEIISPDTVGVGKPFLVRLTSWYPLEDVRIQWNGKTMIPTVTKANKKHNAIAMLGIGAAR